MQANQFFDRGDYASSVESYEIALKESPNNPTILIELAEPKQILVITRAPCLISTLQSS